MLCLPGMELHSSWTTNSIFQVAVVLLPCAFALPNPANITEDEPFQRERMECATRKNSYLDPERDPA